MNFICQDYVNYKNKAVIMGFVPELESGESVLKPYKFKSVSLSENDSKLFGVSEEGFLMFLITDEDYQPSLISVDIEIDGVLHTYYPSITTPVLAAGFILNDGGSGGGSDDEEAS